MSDIITERLEDCAEIIEENTQNGDDYEKEANFTATTREEWLEHVYQES